MPHGFHTLLLSVDGGLLAFGRNSSAQLGLGHSDTLPGPQKVPWNGARPVQAAWGYDFSLVLDEEGSVWETGKSRTAAGTSLFQRVQELPPITAVTAGYSLCAALDTNGGVWMWTKDSSFPWACSSPQRLEGFPPLLKVSCGHKFLVAESQEEGLWVLGAKSLGPTQVKVNGVSDGPFRSLEASSNSIVILDSKGVLWSSGNFLGLTRVSGFQFHPIEEIPPMVAHSCGYYHALALDEKGSVWAWGSGHDGRLGLGNTSDQSQPTPLDLSDETSALVAGGSHSILLSRDGSLLVFGENN